MTKTPWWAKTVNLAVGSAATFGLGLLTGLAQGMKFREAAIIAGAAALGPMAEPTVARVRRGVRKRA